MDSSEDDAPLATRRRGSMQLQSYAEDSSSDDDVPLSARKEPTRSRLKRAPRPVVKDEPMPEAGASVAEDESSDDDDVPIARRRPAKQEPVPATNGNADSESSDDDDVPLAARQAGRKKENVLVGSTSASRLKRKPAKNEDMLAENGPEKKKRKTKAKGKAAAAKEKAKEKAKAAKAKAKKKGATPKKSTPKKSGEGNTKASVKYELPGQRRATPLENDPTRLFYESMYHEKLKLGRPSALAEEWMLRHGLFDTKTAEMVLKKLKK